MKNTSQTGKRGEDAACLYLQKLGHHIVARNWRALHKEIDIISVFADEIHIVEVKSRTAPVPAAPELNVNLRKQRNLASAALSFLHSAGRNRLPAGAEIVFDVVSVVFDGPKTIVTYYESAYTPLYV